MILLTIDECKEGAQEIEEQCKLEIEPLGQFDAMLAFLCLYAKRE